MRPLRGLAGVQPAATFRKSRHSALVGTGLDVWLTQQRIGRIAASGIRTEQCCETTARHACDLGWAVDDVPDATLTFDMAHEDGSLLAAADIKRRTAAVLKDRFAAICSVMAAAAHTSTRHLTRLFVEHAGVPPLDCLRRIRLAVAQAALQLRRNVTQAAGLAGFSSDTQLRRAWHRFGMEGRPSAAAQ